MLTAETAGARKKLSAVAARILSAPLLKATVMATFIVGFFFVVFAPVAFAEQEAQDLLRRLE